MIDKIKENWEKILLILKEEHEVSVFPTGHGFSH